MHTVLYALAALLLIVSIIFFVLSKKASTSSKQKSDRAVGIVCLVLAAVLAVAGYMKTDHAYYYYF
jgi:hypothetical protein